MGAAQQQPTVWTPGQKAHAVIGHVAAIVQDVDGLPRRRVPQHDGAVSAAGSEKGAVVGKGEVPDLVAVMSQLGRQGRGKVVHVALVVVIERGRGVDVVKETALHLRRLHLVQQHGQSVLGNHDGRGDALGQFGQQRLPRLSRGSVPACLHPQLPCVLNEHERGQEMQPQSVVL